MQEENWNAKNSDLEVKLENLRKEEESNRKDLRKEIDSAVEKLASREKENEKRMKKKDEEHNDAKERIKKAIAQVMLLFDLVV